MCRDLDTEGPVPGQTAIDAFEPCDMGLCAAPRGHAGSCAEASGWAE